MRYVAKRIAPAQFESWKATATDDWAPDFDNLQKPEKPILHQALLAEQGHACCYCGRRIAASNSHIEHFRPQKTYPQLALDYANLFASCNAEAGIKSKTHCGQAKGHQFDEALHLSPCDAGCERCFVYGLDGQILAAADGDVHAPYMICVLGLNVKFLQNRRNQFLDILFIDDEPLTDAELIRLYEACGRPDTAGVLPEYGHVLRRFIEQLLALNGIIPP